MELWDIYDSKQKLTGRAGERGKPLGKDEYHLVVHVWIQNTKDEFLITKRTHDKSTFPDMWECTGGSALVGETSLQAALRETLEETGITLDASLGTLAFTIQRRDEFSDVWLFQHDCPLSDIVCQEHETSDALWANKTVIDDLIEKGQFIGREIFTYLDDLLRPDRGITTAFANIIQLFQSDLQNKSCIEILFEVINSSRFTHCWMGKLPDKETGRDVYWLGLTRDGQGAYDYVSFAEMSEAKVFDGKSLKEIWNDVVLLQIDGCDPEERIMNYIR